MSALTDADQARGLTEPEGDARDLAAKLADARRLAESAARTAARLTRERDEARESLAWWTEVQPCDLRHSEPFDFGGCETHDRTFPLGGACDHAGLSEVEWMEQCEQEQRVRAIRAEDERDEARANPRDEWHTMDELYEYRMLYNALAANAMPDRAVKSWRHSDGEPCFGGGWFVVYLNLPTGQVSNHYRAKHWGLFDIPESDRAPELDGHTPTIAAERIRAALEAPRG